MKRALLALPLLALLVSCSRNIHPNAIDKLDSQTYDTLIVAQSVLDNAKAAYKQGKLPESTKPVINATGSAYNMLRDLWIEYRVSPNASTAEKMLAAARELNKLVLELRGMGVK